VLPQDALKFPLVGSAVLFGLFITFKVLPKNLVNLVLAGYFALLGVLALTATVLPFIEQLCSARVKKLSWTAPKFHLPSWLSKVSPLELHCSNPTASISMLAADSPGHQPGRQSIANQNYLNSATLLAYKTALIQLHSVQIHGKTQRFLKYVTEARILVVKAELV